MARRYAWITTAAGGPTGVTAVARDDGLQRRGAGGHRQSRTERVAACLLRAGTGHHRDELLGRRECRVVEHEPLTAGASHVPAVHHQLVGRGDADRGGGRLEAGDPRGALPGDRVRPGLDQPLQPVGGLATPVVGQQRGVALRRGLRPVGGLLLAPGHGERLREATYVLHQVAEGVLRARSRVAELVVAHSVHQSGHLAGGRSEVVHHRLLTNRVTRTDRPAVRDSSVLHEAVEHPEARAAAVESPLASPPERSAVDRLRGRRALS